MEDYSLQPNFDFKLGDIKAILLDLMLLHGYVIQLNGRYYFTCTRDSFHPEHCPVNIDGICTMAWDELPIHALHRWDGRNMWKCPCG